uniref:Uncharacterized protein n=1 Tax=Leptobrachium leishanense TaxID=445787 RepID=A0A8C5P9W7_9ANUR
MTPWRLALLGCELCAGSLSQDCAVPRGDPGARLASICSQSHSAPREKKSQIRPPFSSWDEVSIEFNGGAFFRRSVTFPGHSAIQRAGNSPNPGELPAHTVPVRCLFEGSEIPIKKHCFGYSENTNQQ